MEFKIRVDNSRFLQILGFIAELCHSEGFRSTVFYSIIVLHKKNVGSDQFKVSFGWVEGILVQTP